LRLLTGETTYGVSSSEVIVVGEAAVSSAVTS
jgi:hypothetical protein